MSKSKLGIHRKSVRTSMDAVSGKLVRVVLDDAQLAMERATCGVENACLRVPPSAGAEAWYAIVREAQGVLARLEAGEGIVQPPASSPYYSLVREYGLLDASGRFRFAEKCRLWLRKMLPYRDRDLETTHTEAA